MFFYLFFLAPGSTAWNSWSGFHLLHVQVRGAGSKPEDEIEIEALWFNILKDRYLELGFGVLDFEDAGVEAGAGEQAAAGGEAGAGVEAAAGEEAAARVEAEAGAEAGAWVEGEAGVEGEVVVEGDAGVEAAVKVFLNLKPLLALVVGATTTGGVLDLGWGSGIVGRSIDSLTAGLGSKIASSSSSSAPTRLQNWV